MFCDIWDRRVYLSMFINANWDIELDTKLIFMETEILLVWGRRIDFEWISASWKNKIKAWVGNEGPPPPPHCYFMESRRWGNLEGFEIIQCRGKLGMEKMMLGYRVVPSKVLEISKTFSMFLSLYIYLSLSSGCLSRCVIL